MHLYIRHGEPRRYSIRIGTHASSWVRGPMREEVIESIYQLRPRTCVFLQPGGPSPGAAEMPRESNPEFVSWHHS